MAIPALAAVLSSANIGRFLTIALPFVASKNFVDDFSSNSYSQVSSVTVGTKVISEDGQTVTTEDITIPKVVSKDTTVQTGQSLLDVLNVNSNQLSRVVGDALTAQTVTLQDAIMQLANAVNKQTEQIAIKNIYADSSYSLEVNRQIADYDGAENKLVTAINTNIESLNALAPDSDYSSTINNINNTLTGLRNDTDNNSINITQRGTEISAVALDVQALNTFKTDTETVLPAVQTTVNGYTASITSIETVNSQLQADLTTLGNTVDLLEPSVTVNIPENSIQVDSTTTIEGMTDVASAVTALKTSSESYHQKQNTIADKVIDESLVEKQAKKADKEGIIAEYKTTTFPILDLDGNIVATAKPMEVSAIREATQARTATDENQFEMENDDLTHLPFFIPAYQKTDYEGAFGALASGDTQAFLDGLSS